MQESSRPIGHLEALPGRKVPLVWSRGEAQVWALGAAIHNLTFQLPNGLTVRPLAEAPWHGEAGIAEDETIAPHLRHLGGEWPCVPFGRSAADPVAHGFGTDNLWTCVAHSEGFQRWRIEYPMDRAIAAVEREIRVVDGGFDLEFTLSVDARIDCTLPVGLHPIVRLPEADERFEIDADFGFGETFPVVFEQGVSKLKPAARFAQLDRLPLAGGGTIPIAELCRRQTEEAFQLMAAEGSVALSYPDAGYRLQISWNPAAFSTCLFWLSAGGRTAKPWGGRFRGLGVEPLEAKFVDRAGQGAIAGGLRFRAGERWSTRYRIGVEEMLSGRSAKR